MGFSLSSTWYILQVEERISSANCRSPFVLPTHQDFCGRAALGICSPELPVATVNNGSNSVFDSVVSTSMGTLRKRRKREHL